MDKAENLILKFLLGESVSYKELAEFAYQRKQVETILTHSSTQIIEHLIKVLKWDDPVHNEKHLANLTDFVRVALKAVENAKKTPSAREVSFWLYFEKQRSKIQNTIDYLSREDKYGKLREYRSDEEVKDLLDIIFEELGEYLVQSKFVTMKEFLFDLGIRVASPKSIMRDAGKKMKRGKK